MDSSNQEALKSFFVPGAIIVCAVIALLRSRPEAVPASVASFYCLATLVGGLLLAWRFYSTRILFVLAVLLLSQVGVHLLKEQYASTPTASAVFAAITILLPLNFIVLAYLREKGFTAPAVASRLFFLFLQSVFVVLMSRPEYAAIARMLSSPLLKAHWFRWTRVPQLGLLAFLLALVVLLLRFLWHRKPVESGFFWALLLTFLGLQFDGEKIANPYIATAGLVLVVSVIETSYLMAYHDELTGLPARRAFNQAVLGLQEQYAVAIVDIDHFKSFNDTYGHDIGDQVLRMVASRLKEVTGGGTAFRCGGEEFSILFPGKSAREGFEHLEMMRRIIEQSGFRVRGGLDRRRTPRGVDRRRIAVKRRGTRRRKPLRRAGSLVSVTVSIGVAEPSTRNPQVEQVIRAADEALYRAKRTGRNRVEMDGAERAHAATFS